MATEPHSLPVAQVRRSVFAALTDFYRQDVDLVERDANERSITHKLAEHLQKRFPDWQVDCEYNRRGKHHKRLRLPFEGVRVDAGSDEAKTVFPDILIHFRGTDRNLVVIEVKKVSGSDDTRDRHKIVAFSSSPEYQYQYGLVLRIGADRTSSTLCRYASETGTWEDWTGELQRALAEPHR